MGRIPFFLAIGVLCFNSWAFSQDSSDPAEPKYLQLSFEGTGERLTDDLIEVLLPVLQPRDMARMQALIQNHSISLQSLLPAQQTVLLEQGRLIKQQEQSQYWADAQNPRYVLPVVSVSGRSFIAVDKDDFKALSFDTLIPIELFDTDPYWSHFETRLRFTQRETYSFVAVSPIPLEAIYLLMRDLCLSQWTSRTFSLRDLDVNRAAAGQEVELDYAQFEKWRKCDFSN